MWIHNRRATVVWVAVVGLLLHSQSSAQSAPVPPPKSPTEKEMEPWWADLEKGDAEASRALLKFAAWPKESVAILANRMRPLKIDADRVKTLFTALNSDKEDVWKPAFEELDYFDPRLAIDIENLMNEVNAAPARQRLVALLSGSKPEINEGKQIQLRGSGEGDKKFFNFFDERGSWWAEHLVGRLNTSGRGNVRKKWTRATRAIALLEHIGTPEAVAVLKNMSSGHADAHPTKEAKESLIRIWAKDRPN